MRVSIIMPVLNEAVGIEAALQPLQSWRKAGHELIVVDGGSTDATREKAGPRADVVLSGSPGRALQMNLGAAHARGELLLFLHADTQLPHSALQTLPSLFDHGEPGWGRFDVRLSGSRRAFRVIEWAMNIRSRLTGIATGDQGLFVCRALFEAVGGFPMIPLMEDIALSRVLKRRIRPLCLRTPVVTDSRRWERNGVVKTVLLMWRLRWQYWRGVSPEKLVARYYPGRTCAPSRSHDRAKSRNAPVS